MDEDVEYVDDRHAGGPQLFHDLLEREVGRKLHFHFPAVFKMDDQVEIVHDVERHEHAATSPSSGDDVQVDPLDLRIRNRNRVVWILYAVQLDFIVLEVAAANERMGNAHRRVDGESRHRENLLREIFRLVRI